MARRLLDRLVWQRATGIHFVTSLLLAPYVLWRFLDEPLALDQFEGLPKQAALLLVDLVGGLLLYVPKQSLYTDGFTGPLHKPEIYVAEPNLWLYALLVPINSILFGLLITFVVRVGHILRDQ